MFLRLCPYLIVRIVIAAIILLPIIQLLPIQSAFSKDVVRIAANLPMTGDLAIYGKAIQKGATLALEDLKKWIEWSMSALR
jgi:outer membrane PBP1 activator LpoA protein